MYRASDVSFLGGGFLGECGRGKMSNWGAKSNVEEECVWWAVKSWSRSGGEWAKADNSGAKGHVEADTLGGQ
jgi:hypothetical protein